MDSSFDSLTTIGSWLRISSNDNLVNLNSLNNLVTIGTSCNIRDNNSLTTLSNSLSNLTSVGDWFDIWNNINLNSLSGLDNLQSVGGGLGIGYNNSLPSLIGLDNLSTVGSYFNIRNNNSLQNLNGLENLNSIGDWLHISENPSLTTLSGIDNLDHTTITHLYARLSSNLSTCSVPSICAYLANSSNLFTIYSNASGCNTYTEILVDCSNLPIEMTNFWGQADNDFIALNWETLSEQQNKGFDVEKLQEESSIWEPIGFVEGNGFTNISHKYYFKDEDPKNGSNYYRLKQMDFDGNYSYSNIIDIDFQLDNVIYVSPNPTNGIIHINGFEGETIRVIDNLGNLMKEESTSNTRINIENLPSGIYFIQFNIGSKIITHKIIKQ